MSNIFIFGHRGASAEKPGNTIEAFQKAYETGADGIELDIRKTKDNRLVVVHNEELDLPGRQDKYIFDYHYDELKQWLPQLPLLSEVLDLYKNKLKLEIEIKRQDLFTIDTCLQLIEMYNFEQHVEIISFHATVLAEIKKKKPEIATGLIFEPFPEWMQGRYREVAVLDALRIIDANVVHLSLDVLTEEMVSMIHSDGRRIQASSVESAEQLKRAIDLGLEQLTTNRPGEIVRLRNDQNSRS